MKKTRQAGRVLFVGYDDRLTKVVDSLKKHAQDAVYKEHRKAQYTYTESIPYLFWTQLQELSYRDYEEKKSFK